MERRTEARAQKGRNFVYYAPLSTPYLSLRDVHVAIAGDAESWQMVGGHAPERCPPGEGSRGPRVAVDGEGVVTYDGAWLASGAFLLKHVRAVVGSVPPKREQKLFKEPCAPKNLEPTGS